MALVCGVRMRLTASLNCTNVSSGIVSVPAPRALAKRVRKALRWSMANAAMTPRESETAWSPAHFPFEILTNPPPSPRLRRVTALRGGLPNKKQNLPGVKGHPAALGKRSSANGPAEGTMEPAVLRFITHHFFYFLISQMSNSGDLTSSVEQVELPLLLPGALTAPLVTSGLTARQSNLDMTRHGVYSFI